MMAKFLELTPQYPYFYGKHKGYDFHIKLGKSKVVCKNTKEVRYWISYGRGNGQTNGFMRFCIPPKRKFQGTWPFDKENGFKFTQKEMVEQAYLHIIETINLKVSEMTSHKSDFDRLAFEINPAE